MEKYSSQSCFYGTLSSSECFIQGGHQLWLPLAQQNASKSCLFTEPWPPYITAWGPLLCGQSKVPPHTALTFSLKLKLIWASDSATLNFHRYLLWLTICSSVIWMWMCIKVLLVTMPYTFVPHRSSDVGTKDKSVSFGFDMPGGNHRELAVWPWAS